MEKAKLIHLDLQPANLMIHIDEYDINYERKMIREKTFLKEIIKNEITFTIKLIDLGCA